VSLDLQTYVKCFKAITPTEDDLATEEDVELDSYLRYALAPRDGLKLQDVAFANALAESYHDSALITKISVDIGNQEEVKVAD